MRLAQYLQEKDLTHRALAAQIGCSRVMVTYYVNGRSRPGGELCARITDVTDGAVTADDHQAQYIEARSARAE